MKTPRQLALPLSRTTTTTTIRASKLNRKMQYGTRHACAYVYTVRCAVGLVYSAKPVAALVFERSILPATLHTTSPIALLQVTLR